MYRVSLIQVDKGTIKEANTLIYNFLWNGKGKTKPLALGNDYENGGLKPPHLESITSVFISSPDSVYRKQYLAIIYMGLDHVSSFRAISKLINYRLVFCPSMIYSSESSKCLKILKSRLWANWKS